MADAPLLSLAAAAQRTAAWRRDAKKVVAVSGSFDLLHAGHERLIAEARAAGDALVVLVNSDASVRAYKGPGRPLNGEQTRAAAIAHLPGVDAVVLFDEIVPLAALKALMPDVVANGPDYGADCIEKPLVESWGGRILVTSPRAISDSSSEVARGQGRAPNPKAIMLDRDGTLIEDPGYLSRPEQVVWKEGALEALKLFRAAGYRLFIVTNQSGIARGLFSVADMENVHRKIEADLAERGLALDGIYHCPHGPDDDCECRKPKSGLLQQAAREHGLDLSKSWLIGDKCSDIAAGRMANMKTALVHSDASCLPGPTLRATTLAAAAAAILER